MCYVLGCEKGIRTVSIWVMQGRGRVVYSYCCDFVIIVQDLLNIHHIILHPRRLFLKILCDSLGGGLGIFTIGGGLGTFIRGGMTIGTATGEWLGQEFAIGEALFLLRSMEEV